MERRKNAELAAKVAELEQRHQADILDYLDRRNAGNAAPAPLLPPTPPQPPTPPPSDYEPIQIRVKVNGGNPTRHIDCDVPCLRSSGKGLQHTLTFEGAPWSMVQGMEGPQYYPNLRMPNVPEENKFWSTTSMKSAIPMPYFSWAEYSIQDPAVEYDETIKGASFIARNCGSKNDREGLVTGLQDFFRVDSLSSCLHNAESRVGTKDKGERAKRSERILRASLDEDEKYIRATTKLTLFSFFWLARLPPDHHPSL